MSDKSLTKKIEPMNNSNLVPASGDDERLPRNFFSPRPELAGPEFYPRMTNMSAGFTYQATLRTWAPETPEYVTVNMPHRSLKNEEGLALELAVAQWNAVWEAAQYRRRMFADEDLPEQLRNVADLGDHNVVFVPRTRSRYFEYAPLFHLLPTSTLQIFGLPQLTAGQWPFVIRHTNIDHYLPDNFEHKLSKAWAATVWRHLISGSPMRGFSADDPIRILSHNLDYWIPAATTTIQEILSSFPVVNNVKNAQQVVLEDGSLLPGVEIGNPRMGGDLWTGEHEAAEVVARVVEKADEDGQLRGILDAIRSNRIEDDFSDKWSNEKADFERRLYKTRSKTKVTFVELTDTIPVQGPETEIIESMVYGDFLAILNAKNREIVVLLRSGTTSLTEIAEIMGYANHSPISKRLGQIRHQAEAFFRGMA